MTIGAILSGREMNIISVERGTSVKHAVTKLAEHRIGAMPVVDGNEVIGIISERDVIYNLSSQGASILDATVADVMTSPAITVSRDVAVLSALSQMTRRRIRHLPVVERGQLVGIVSIGDLVKYRIDRIEQEAEAMREYIQSA